MKASIQSNENEATSSDELERQEGNEPGPD